MLPEIFCLGVQRCYGVLVLLIVRQFLRIVSECHLERDKSGLPGILRDAQQKIMQLLLIVVDKHTLLRRDYAYIDVQILC